MYILLQYLNVRSAACLWCGRLRPYTLILDLNDKDEQGKKTLPYFASLKWFAYTISKIVLS